MISLLQNLCRFVVLYPSSSGYSGVEGYNLEVVDASKVRVLGRSRNLVVGSDSVIDIVMPKQQPLEYDAHVPAFLHRLKTGHAALDGRHNVQIPRARGNAGKSGRLNMHGEEGEDDPVMLDESGNVVSKEEMERLETAEKDEKNGEASNDVATNSTNQEAEGHTNDADRRTKEDTVNVSSGFGKKRKAVKVVAEDEEGAKQTVASDDDANEPVKSLKESTKDLHDVVAEGKEQAKKEIGTNGTAKKGKRKKVKLSFDEPE